MDLTLIRSDLLLPIVGRAECSVQSLCAKINFLLIFHDKSRSFIGEYYGAIQGNLHYCSVSTARGFTMLSEVSGETLKHRRFP